MLLDHQVGSLLILVRVLALSNKLLVILMIQLFSWVIDILLGAMFDMMVDVCVNPVSFRLSSGVIGHFKSSMAVSWVD